MIVRHGRFDGAQLILQVRPEQHALREFTNLHDRLVWRLSNTGAVVGFQKDNARPSTLVEANTLAFR